MPSVNFYVGISWALYPEFKPYALNTGFPGELRRVCEFSQKGLRILWRNFHAVKPAPEDR